MAMLIPQICGCGRLNGYVIRKFAGRDNEATNHKGPRVLENEDLLKQVKKVKMDSKNKPTIEWPNEATSTRVTMMSLHLDDLIKWLA